MKIIAAFLGAASLLAVAGSAGNAQEVRELSRSARPPAAPRRRASPLGAAPASFRTVSASAARASTAAMAMATTGPPALALRLRLRTTVRLSALRLLLAQLIAVWSRVAAMTHDA